MRTALRAIVFFAATLVIGVAAYNAWWEFAVRSDVCNCGWLSTVTLEYGLGILLALQLIAAALVWAVGRRMFPTRPGQLRQPHG